MRALIYMGIIGKVGGGDGGESVGGGGGGGGRSEKREGRREVGKIIY